MRATMWLALAGVCGLQLWVLLGLLPAFGGGLVATIWCGLALVVLLAGLVALRRSPDAGALFLCLVLPVTLIPTFVVGRGTQPLLGLPWIQALAGAALVGLLLAVVRARRDALTYRPPGGEIARIGVTHPPRAALDDRIATLVLAALWLALPARALLDPSLVEAPLGQEDPVEAKMILVLAAWASVTLLAFGAVLPALAARAPTTEPPSRRTLLWVASGTLLLMAWAALVLAGA